MFVEQHGGKTQGQLASLWGEGVTQQNISAAKHTIRISVAKKDLRRARERDDLKRSKFQERLKLKTAAQLI